MNNSNIRMKNRRSAEQELSRLAADPRTRQMTAFCQHGRVSTYEHCLNVAEMSLEIDEKLHANCQRQELVRGAMLHDYFLYDWHHWGGHGHGFSHAHQAAENAVRDFDISEIEKQIIESHMWPLNLSKLPRSREAWIVCLADKVCSLKETLTER